MRMIPRVVYGTTTLTFTYPQRLWTPLSTTIGGSNTSAAGITESYVIRRDYLLEARLVFDETEWPAVHDWIVWAQANPGLTFRFWPDATAPGDYYDCFLDGPKVGEEVRPERGEFQRTFEITLRLRSRDARMFNLRTHV
ncbi:MAG TPA: hypothetical protein VFH27_02610 [Longimicrobiaceae bacterium]|nr:hypothetical protein [Longimicrobiaceae bacterium]